jgi:hypothetical protein
MASLLKRIVRELTPSRKAEEPHVLKNITQKDTIRRDKKMRKNINEKQIDKTLKDSFPASDPPGGY